MLTAVLRRVVLSVLSLLMLATFIFVATEVLPGDALDVTLSADEIAMIVERFGDAVDAAVAGL